MPTYPFTPVLSVANPIPKSKSCTSPPLPHFTELFPCISAQPVFLRIRFPCHLHFSSFGCVLTTSLIHSNPFMSVHLHQFTHSQLSDYLIWSTPTLPRVFDIWDHFPVPLNFCHSHQGQLSVSLLDFASIVAAKRCTWQNTRDILLLECQSMTTTSVLAW